jgi:CO/xanthine dehydrogenase Mo-binding subunit
MALGASVLEEYIYKNGLMVNSSYGNYRIPTFQEMPLRKNVMSLFAPDPLPDGPYGSKGLGEGTMLAVAPAIANAIYNAVGIRLKDLPLNPERVLQALKDSQGQSNGNGRS